MRMIKLGIIALMMLGLTACGDPKPKVTELTKAQIQADVVAHLNEVYSEATVEDFAVASDSELRETKTVIGTMSLKTPISSLTGNYTNVYKLVGETWTLESSLFTPKIYTWIDPATWPDQARVEADLKNAVLKHPIEQIEKVEYTFNHSNNSALSCQIDLTYRSAIGTVTTQLASGYAFVDQAWTFGLGQEISTTITDFKQRPLEEDMLTWSIMTFHGGDSDTGITEADSHLISSDFDAKTGTLLNTYHLDKWILSHMRYVADITVIGWYDTEVGWMIETQDVVLSKTLDLNMKEQFVWESMNAAESVYTKGDTLELDLTGSMTITTPTETEWTLNVSGTVKVNGVSHDLTFRKTTYFEANYYALELSYGPGPKDKFILCYWWHERYNEFDWYILSPDQSEAYLVP